MALEFLIIGLIILIGFASTLFFDRTRISQVIILMLFGFLLGQVLEYQQIDLLVSLLPFLSVLALIVLLFDGGMEFDIFGMARAIPKSMLFTLVVFVLSVVLVSLFAFFFLNLPLEHGALLGAVLGGVSSAVVIAMIDKTHIKRDSKAMLTVESTMTDALCIITAIIIAQIITADYVPEAGLVANLLLSQFTIAILFGIVAAILWICILGRYSPGTYAYMLMLAVVFMLYAITTDLVMANGGIAVFVFGLVLGNARKLGKFVQIKWENPINHMMRLFQEEVTFFTRTFFFVYIGILLASKIFSFEVILISLCIVILLIIVRFVSQRLVLPHLHERDSNITITMMPRGLAAAVLATYPLISDIKIENFAEIIFAVLLFSNVVATIGIIAYNNVEEETEKKGKKSGRNDKKNKDYYNITYGKRKNNHKNNSPNKRNNKNKSNTNNNQSKRNNNRSGTTRVNNNLRSRRRTDYKRKNSNHSRRNNNR